MSERVSRKNKEERQKQKKEKKRLQGEKAELWCEATGVPQPVITWFKNEEAVDAGKFSSSIM